MLLTNDSYTYLQNAKDIANFNMPTNPDRPPLISLLFALTGAISEQSNFSWLLLVHLIMHGAVVCAVVYLLFDMGIKKGPCIAAAILLWLPIYTEHTAYVLSETFTEFLLMLIFLGIYQFLKNEKNLFLYLAAFSSAAIALVKPTFQALSPFLVLILLPIRCWISPLRLTLKKAICISLTFLLFYFVLLGGWVAQNYLRHGFFGLTQFSGFHLASKTARVVERLPESFGEVREVLLKYRDQSLVLRHSSHTGSLYISDAIPELQKITGKTKVELAQYMFKINKLLILKAPLEYLHEVATSSVSYWFPGVTKRTFGDSKMAHLFWAMLEFIVNGLFLGIPILIAGKLASCKFDTVHNEKYPLRRMSFLIALGLIIYNWVITCAYVVGSPRCRRPTDFLIVFLVILVLFSGADVWRIMKQFSREPLK